MEATELAKALRSMAEGMENPPSPMEMVRNAVLAHHARASRPEMPPILTAEQRETFTENVGLVAGFLESENGADSVELLVGAFNAYVKEHEDAEEDD